MNKLPDKTYFQAIVIDCVHIDGTKRKKIYVRYTIQMPHIHSLC